MTAADAIVIQMAKHMRVDAHQHFWRYRAEDYPWMDDSMQVLRRDWLPDDLMPVLDAAGMDACIAVQARADEAENTFLLQLAREYPRIAGVVGWVDMLSETSAERVQYWRAQPKFVGVRHLLQDDADVAVTVNDPSFNRTLTVVQQQRLIYEILVRGNTQLALIPALCARHDQYWLVLDHLGKPAIGGMEDAEWQRHLKAVAAYPHVACKVSGLVTEVIGAQLERELIQRYLDFALNAFGPSRLLFGSDWPVCALRADYMEVMALVHDWAARQLSADKQDLIWGGNAARYYLQEGSWSCISTKKPSL